MLICHFSQASDLTHTRMLIYEQSQGVTQYYQNQTPCGSNGSVLSVELNSCFRIQFITVQVQLYLYVAFHGVKKRALLLSDITQYIVLGRFGPCTAFRTVRLQPIPLTSFSLHLKLEIGGLSSRTSMYCREHSRQTKFTHSKTMVRFEKLVFKI